jgi:hypothetical protein
MFYPSFIAEGLRMFHFQSLSIKSTLRLLVMLTCFISLLHAQQRNPEVYDTVDGDPIYRLLPPNAIPAILNPEYLSGEEADKQMQNSEPVMGLVMDGRAMAYSLWQLDAHEIVNDEVNGTPIAVTW